MDKWDKSLPNPPEFLDSELKVTLFFPFNHPYTRWMLNMIRSDANYRLTTMIKERPELFRQIYQIPDMPELIRNDSYDQKPMYHKSAVLYFNPLCLAIYMKKEKAVNLIIKSGINTPHQKVFAAEVYKRGQNSGGDILQVLPICICIAREFFECFTTLINSKYHSVFSQDIHFSVKNKIELFYENRDGRRVYRYKDLLAYGIHFLKKRGCFPMSRLLDVLFVISEEFKNGTMSNLEDDDRSLFRKFAQLAYYEDIECRMSMQLIQCMDILLKNKCYPWESVVSSKSKYLFNRLKSNVPEIIDQDASLGLLLGLYHRIQLKIKNGALNYIGELVNKTLLSSHWKNAFFTINSNNLYEYFMNIKEQINIPFETIDLVKRHLKTLNDLDKERDIRAFTADNKSNKKGKMAGGSHHRRSCSLVSQNTLLTRENWLLSRAHDTTSSAISVVSMTPLCTSPMPLFSYKPIPSNPSVQTRSPHHFIDEKHKEKSQYSSDEADTNQVQSKQITHSLTDFEMNEEKVEIDQLKEEKYHQQQKVNKNNVLATKVIENSENSKYQSESFSDVEEVLQLTHDSESFKQTSIKYDTQNSTNIRKLLLEDDTLNGNLSNAYEFENNNNINRYLKNNQSNDSDSLSDGINDLDFDSSEQNVDLYEEMILKEMCGDYNARNNLGILNINSKSKHNLNQIPRHTLDKEFGMAIK